MRVSRRTASSLSPLIFLIAAGAAARGETMSNALVAAYLANPDINQQRAANRAMDENVPRAKSGFLPHLDGLESLGYSTTDAVHGQQLDTKSGTAVINKSRLTIRQMVFDGGATVNQVARAESQVFESRATTDAMEQQILLATATAYMDVLRDTALLDLRKNDVELLIYRLREARARYRISEVTATDVAEVAAFLATARSDYFRQQATLIQSIAAYRRLVGHEPKRLEAARPIDAYLPASLTSAEALALRDHPQIISALHAADAVTSEIHILEARLYPQLNLRNRLGDYIGDHGNKNRNFFLNEGTADVTAPLYDGGSNEALVRAAKERLTEARLKVASMRDLVRAGVMSSWGQLAATKVLVHSAEAAVQSAETAFIGVREEARVGQRTTYDLLRAIQALLQARVTLISAQRDRVVATYQVMAAMGQLTTTRLALSVEPYDPTIHYKMVKDKWIGLRTPEGQ